MIKPRTRAPELSVDTVGGGRWNLAEQKPEQFTLVVFYRGLHCPICKGYLPDLQSQLDAFRKRGVEVVAISADPRDRAEQAKREWGLDRLRIGYGLPIETAREWGLFISEGISDKETAQFSEPGVFLIRPDGTVYYEAIQSMPFARPSFRELLGAIDVVTAKNYPARGEA